MKNSSFSNQFPSIAGIDVATIMKRLHLDWKTYKYIALGFLEQHEHSLIKIREAYTNHDRQQLRMLSHSIKGSSASIGALSLSETAKKIEEACKQDQEWPEAGNMRDFETYFQELIASLKELTTTSRQTVKSETTDRKVPLRILALVTEIRDELEKQDPSKLQDMTEVLEHQIKKTGYSHDYLSALQKALHQFDYDDAVNILDLFIKEHGKL